MYVVEPRLFQKTAQVGYLIRSVVHFRWGQRRVQFGGFYLVDEAIKFTLETQVERLLAEKLKSCTLVAGKCTTRGEAVRRCNACKRNRAGRSCCLLCCRPVD